MNARAMAAQLLCCLFMLGIASGVTAQPTDVFNLMKDPLKTVPVRLDLGTTLPGDAAPVTCPEQKDLSQPLVLGDAVDLALCNNPQIQSAWAAIKVQASALGEARAAYLPTLQGTASRLNSHTGYPGSGGPATSSTGNTVFVGMNWRLLDFGARAANTNLALQNLTAALASHDATLQATLTSVVQAYFDAVTALATLDAQRQAVAVANGTLESAHRRESKGAAAHSDALQAATALAKAALARSRAEGNLHKSLAVLVFALGVPSGSDVRVAEIMNADISETQEQVRELNSWLATAQESHPAILAARAQLEASKQKVKSATSDGLPTLDLTANRYQNGYPGQGLQPSRTTVNTVGVTLTVPLFDGFARGYKIRGAQAQAEQSEAQLRDTERQILSEVIKAHADALSSLQNLADSQTLIETARESQATSDRRYNKGVADIVELLNAQGALADALQERVKCLSEWRSARLKILSSVGGLGRDFVR